MSPIKKSGKIPKRSVLFRDFPFFAALALFFTSLATLQSATVPYFCDFESPVGSEWSSTLTDNSTVAVFSRFSGRFANDTQSLTLTGLTPGQSYTLSLDLYVIDSWDGNSSAYGPDYFNISVNGNQVFHHTFTQYAPQQPQTFPFSPDLGPTSLGFNSNHTDSIYRKIEVEFVASTGSATIAFKGDGLSSITDESWGLDNVCVEVAPPNASDLSLWLSAGSGVVADSSNSISEWKDRSQFQKDFSQQTPEQRPTLAVQNLNGFPVAHFDGANDNLSVSSSTGWGGNQFSVTFLIKPLANISYNQVIGATSTASWGSFLFHVDASGGVYVGTDVNSRMTPGSGPGQIPSGTVELGKWQVFTFTMNNGQAAFYKNGSWIASKSVAPSSPWSHFSLGHGDARTLSAEVAELMVHNRELTQAECDEVGLHLANKYETYHQDADWISSFSPYLQSEIHAQQLDKAGAENLATLSLPLVSAGLPIPISGLRLCLVSDSGVQLDSNGRVESWQDISGNGNHASSPNTSNRPSVSSSEPIGTPAIVMEGDDFVQFNRISDIWTVFQVIKYDSASPSHQFILGDSSSYNYHDGGEEIFWRESNGGGVHLNVMNGVTRLNGIEVNPLVAKKPTTWTLLSLAQTGPAVAENFSKDRSYGMFKGKVAAILIYNRSLSVNERLQVESALFEKYEMTLPPPGTDTPSGVYFGSRNVTLSSPVSGAVIRYTLDGTSPTDQSPEYTQPIAIQTSATLKASLFLEGSLNREVLTSNITIQALPSIPQNGMTLWLTADGGVSADTNGFVASWQDVNQNETASQSTPAAKPLLVPGTLNGKPAIRFDGIDDFFTLGASPNLVSGNFTYFVVGAFRGSSGSMALLSRDVGPGNTNKWVYWYNGSGLQFHIQPGNQNLSSTPFVRQIGKFGVFSISKGGLNFSHFMFGLPFGNATSSVDIPAINSDFRIGQAENQFYLNGDIAEVIAFDRILSPAEREEVESYLSAKYSLDDADTDGDGIPNAYEIENGLDPILDDSLYDKDGDGIPNQWEYLKGTAAGDENSVNPDWIVDLAHGGDSTTDNIVSTINQAIAEVPVDNGNAAASYKSILVKRGVHGGKATIPADKRIALIGESGGGIYLEGGALNEHVLEIYGRGVVDGFTITRPATAIATGSTTAAGLYIGDAAVGNVGLIVNTAIIGHTTGVSWGSFWSPWVPAAKLQFCTIAWNRSHGLYAPFRDRVAQGTILNCVIWNPIAGVDAQFASGFQYTYNFAGNIVYGGQFGGNSGDPKLSAEGMLGAGSAALDITTGGDGTFRDIHGDSRPAGSGRDMGADEYVDSDTDGVPDWWEARWFPGLSESEQLDDADGLNLAQEFLNGTNPTLSDSDGDGLTDGQEVLEFGLNPNYSETITVAPDVTVPPGFFNQPVNVGFTSTAPLVQYRYTTDGTEPNAGSSLAEGGVVNLLGTSSLRVRGYRGTFAVTPASGVKRYVIKPEATFPVEGVKLWMKAGEAVQTDASSNVVSWSDISENRPNAVPPGSPASATPVLVEDALPNGSPSVRFNGSNQYLSMPAGADFHSANGTMTVFVYGKWEGGSDLGPFVVTAKSTSWTDGGWGLGRLNTGGSDRLGFWANSYSGQSVFADVPTGGYQLLSGIRDASQIQFLVNGQPVGNSTVSGNITSSGSGLFFGGYPASNRFLNGDIAEVLVYDRALNAAELIQVHEYFEEKYGTTVVRPSANPPSGIYDGQVNITLSSLTPGAAIYYTLDGSEPTIGSSLANGTISITQSGQTLLKARAFLDSSIPSTVFSGVYTIDNDTPVISDAKFNSTSLTSGMVLTAAGTLSVVASDASSINRVEFYVDGQLLAAPSTPVGGRYQATWNISGATPDGAHEVKILAIDQFGKVTSPEAIYPVSLTLARPAAPVLTAPANNAQVATSSILVQGTAAVGSTVNVLRDDVTVASGVPVSATGQFQVTVPLQTGNQTLTATAAFRSGEPGSASAGRTVQRDETVPEAPLSLSATAESGGRIRLDWVASPSTNVAGYRVYRSAAPFEEIGSLQPLNASLLNSLSLVDNSAAVGSANYYRVVPVSGAGVVGNLSNLASATSDGIAPSASAVWSTVDAPFDPTSQSFGIGKIQVILTATEQLRSLPFLSLKPQGGLPVPITLTQDASNPRVFRGEYIISAQTPAGEASLSFVAHDTSGNRGTMLDLGATVILDNEPPAVVVANLPSVIKNSTTTPALIPIEVELDEPAALTPPPVLTYTLSNSQPAAQTLPLTEVPGSNRMRWTASIQLLATAGNNTEDLTLGLLATDDLENSGGSFAVPSTALVYQGALPGLPPPTLNATSAPGGAVILTWGAVEKATEYLLYSGTSADPESLTLLATMQGNEFTHTDVPATDGTYFYAIAARRTVNEEPSAIILSNPPVQALSDRVPPATPTNLLLELSGQGISATWTAPQPEEPVTYQLLRSATSPLTLESGVVRDGIATTQTLDPSPTSAQIHYAVVAVDSVGNRSQPSTHATLNAALYPPATFTITADLAGSHPVRIDWTQSGTAHSGHRLFVGETDPAELLGSVPAGTNSFTDSAYTGTSRRYVIATMDAQNNSSPLKSLRLPGATVGMEPGQRIGRGIINRLKFTVTNTSSEPSEPITNAVLMATVGENTYSSSALLIPAGDSVPAEIFVPGTDTILGSSDTSVSLDLALQVEPTPGTKALLTMPVTLPVIDQAIPVTLQVHDLLRGGNGKASFTVQNPGTENLEIVLSKNNGAIDSPDVRFVMESRTGDPVSVVPVRIGYGDSVHSLAGGDVVLRIPPGATVTSPEFTIPVPSSAPADVVFSLEIDRMWTNYGTASPTELAIPITRSVDVSTLPAPYTARIQTITPATSFGNEPIVISGNTTLQGGVGVAVSQPVTIAISREGFVQTLEATTAPDGTFTVPFTLPSGSPGGTFSVWAYHPEQTNFSPTAAEIRTFVIRRVTASPAEINWAAPRNFEQAFTFQLSAVGGNATNVRAEIHAADQAGGQLPAGLTSNSTTIPILSGTGNLTLKLKISDTTISSGRLIVRMVSDETAPLGFQAIGINYSLRDATPAIVATPSSLSTGKNIGVALSDKITITNQGLAPLMDASWQILNNDPQGSPAPSWVSQVTPALLGNLAPGSSIDLRMDFAATAPQADYDFKIVIRSSNSGPIEFPIHLAVTPAEVGTFSVRVIDLTTGGTVNGGLVGGVQNARVRLQSTVNPSTVFNAVTDTNGQIGLDGTGLSDIPVGLYDLTITSDQHQPYRTSLWIRPGATTMEQAVLQFETVNVTWEVVETTIRDTYEVLATINFATDVPVPVIVATPAAINLPAMETGSVFNGEIAFKNHGAISPDNAKFKLPPGDANFQYEFAPNAYVTPSASDPSTYELTLPPGQTVRVPYKITATRKFEGCTYSTFFNGESITLCPNGTIHRQSFSFGVFASGPNCPQSQPPTPAQYISSGSGSSTSAPTGWKPAPLATTDDCFDPLFRCKDGTICPVPPAPPSSDPGDKTGGGTQGSNSGAVLGSSSSVDLINREYMDGREDLTVAVPGGSLILRRDFYGNQWHFSHDRSLTFVPATDGSGTSTVLRNRVAYAARDAARTVFASDKFTITKQQLTPGVITWRWASPNGQWERYDTNGRLLQAGFREHTLSVLHYPEGATHPTELRDVNGRTIITLDYQNGKLATATDLAGRSVGYDWQNGRLEGFTDPEGQTMTMEYDSAGRMTSKVDRNNQTITINYTPAGFVSAVLGGTEGDQQFAFSFNTSTRTHYARVTFGTDRVVESWYDRDGELIKQSENGVTQVTRTRSGSTITEVDALGRTTLREYDSFDNLIRQVNPDGRTATWEYEPTYQQIRRHVDFRGVVTTYEYFSSTHRLKEVIRGQGTALAQTSAYIWDTAGRLDQVTDPLGMKTKFTYDPVKDLPLTITRGYETPEAQVTTMTYDAVGNLETLSNSLNQTSEFEHDDLRRLRKITNPLNEISTFTYNGTRLTKAETGATGTTPGRGLRKVYDARGRVTAEYQIGTNGAELLVRAMSHDSEGRVLAVTNALGQTVESFTYDAFGRRTSRSVPNTLGGLATTTTEYDNLDRITATVSPEGIRTEFQYDTGDRTLKITDAVGAPEQRVTDMVYNAIGDLSEERFPTANGTLVRVSKFDALGRLSEISGDRTEDFAYTYDKLDNLLTSEDGRGHTTSLTYDILGRLETRTLPSVAGSTPAVTTFTYDKADNLLTEEDGDGRTTGFAYDALNRRLAQSIPVEGSLPATWSTNDALVAQRMTYNAFGEVTATWAPASAVASAATATINQTTFGYDAFGRATSRVVNTAPGKTLTSITAYSIVGQPLTSTTTSTDTTAPQTTRWEYDPANPVIVSTVTDPTGFQIAYDYDGANRVETAARSTGASEVWTYDGLSRIQTHRLSATDAITQVSGFTYNRFNQLLTHTEPGHTTQNPKIATRTYDNKGRLATEGGSASYALTYGYDDTGNLNLLRDANGSETTWTYDARNRLAQKKYADNKIWYFTHDAEGNLLTRKDARNQTITYAYNAFGRVTNIDYPNDADVTFGYDAAGRLTSLSDATGTSTWTPDPWDRTVAATQPLVSRALSVSYNDRGQRATAGLIGANQNNRSITYQYDSLSRLQTLTDTVTGGSFVYSYEPGTRWVSRVETPSGSATVQTRDDLGRVLDKSFRGSTNQELNRFAYTYDAAGQRETETGPRGEVEFGYNGIGELTGAEGLSGGNYTYQYDGIGNRLVSQIPGVLTAYEPNAVNQYAEITPNSQTPVVPLYDLNGNLVSDGKGTSYSYDQENRLVGIQSTTSNKQSVFTYDGLSRRVETRELENGTLTKTIRYVYDGLVPVEEFEWSGAATGSASKVRQITRGIDASGTLQGAGGIGGLLAFTANGASAWYFADANGNVANLFTTSDTASASYTYDPFGRRLTASGPLATANAYQWSGKEYHEPSGLVYYLYRFYDPETGRWLNRDPLQEEGGVNLYASVFNDPINLWDPWGLEATIKDFFQNNATSAALAGNDTQMWMWATLYGVWNGLSFGSLDRTAANQALLEKGCIDEAEFHLRQTFNAFEGLFDLWGSVTGARAIVAVGKSVGLAAGRGLPNLLPRYLPNAANRGVALVPSLGIKASAEASALAKAGSVVDDVAALATKNADDAAEHLARKAAVNRINNKQLSRITEKRVQAKLEARFGKDKVLSERTLRDATGGKVIDPVTKTGRRIDFVVLDDAGKVRYRVEVTSRNQANNYGKLDQLDKEVRIQEAGGIYIRKPGSRDPKDLIDISGVETRVIGVNPL